ncbi:unnamed protein product [Umbelopsis sp. WA50703]
MLTTLTTKQLCKECMKDLVNGHIRYRSLIPNNVHQQCYKHTSMVSTIAAEYCTNFRNDIAKNFAPRTINYFFVRFSAENDEWFLESASVASRWKIAKYAYNMMASGIEEWPDIPDNDVQQAAAIDMWMATLDIGPRPVTDASLQTKANE